MILPVNTQYQTHDLNYILTDSGAKIIIINSDIVPRVRSVANKTEQGIEVGLICGAAQGQNATAEAIKNGWLHTGVLAAIDEADWVRLRGRIKDMIRRGENVAASEIETVTAENTLVNGVAVGSVPDDIRGEEVAAYVLRTHDVRSKV